MPTLHSAAAAAAMVQCFSRSIRAAAGMAHPQHLAGPQPGQPLLRWCNLPPAAAPRSALLRLRAQPPVGLPLQHRAHQRKEGGDQSPRRVCPEMNSLRVTESSRTPLAMHSRACSWVDPETTCPHMRPHTKPYAELPLTCLGVHQQPKRRRRSPSPQRRPALHRRRHSHILGVQ